MTDFTLTPKYRKILFELISKEIQRLAVNASMYEVYGIDTPISRKAAQRRRLLKSILDQLTEQEPS